MRGTWHLVQEAWYKGAGTRRRYLVAAGPWYAMVGKPLAEPTRSAIDAAAFTTVIICLFNDAVQESKVLSQSQAGSTVLPCASVKLQ